MDAQQLLTRITEEAKELLGRNQILNARRNAEATALESVAVIRSRGDDTAAEAEYAGAVAAAAAVRDAKIAAFQAEIDDAEYRASFVTNDRVAAEGVVAAQRSWVDYLVDRIPTAAVGETEIDESLDPTP